MSGEVADVGVGAVPPGVLWSGQPTARPVREDLVAGVVAFAVTALVLGGGLALADGVAPGHAARLGLGYAALVAATTTLGRVAGAGMTATLLAAFFAPVAVAAALTGRQGFGLVCPAASAGLLLFILVLRLRQRRATRYWIAADHAGLGEVGRYAVTFRLAGPPAVRLDRFGAGLGDLDFGQVQARLTTHRGRSFVLPRRACRFQRVQAPEQVLAALAGAPGERG
ncbi:MAG: hypothetical protein M9894_37645 [Planctomycetes bacterium]|nr:hypothetical protein [Planctomycetota bacterium]